MATRSVPEGDVQLNLSREELLRLVQVVYIAAWIMDAHKTEEDARTAPYRELEQKIYAVAARQGVGTRADGRAEELIRYVAHFQKYYPTRELEEGEARTFLDTYDDDTFWDELVWRLAERDAIQEAGGLERYAELASPDRIGLTSRYETSYIVEFEEHGLDRLHIVQARRTRRSAH